VCLLSIPSNTWLQATTRPCSAVCPFIHSSVPKRLQFPSINQSIYTAIHRHTKLSRLRLFDQRVQSFSIHFLNFPFSHSIFYLFRYSFICRTLSICLSVCLSMYRHRIPRSTIAVTSSITAAYIDVKYHQTCLPLLQILALCILRQCCPVFIIFMFIIILLLERHIYYVMSVSVLRNIQWRCCSSSTFTRSATNGMRSLARGCCYVMCVRSGTLRLLLQPLRHGKEIWYMVFPLECAGSLASGGNMNWRVCPMQPICRVAAVIGVQNCYLSKHSARIPRNRNTPVRSVL